MSSDTAPFTSRSADAEGAALTIACAGFCSAALQSVYFRELLSVFRGNELSIGIIFSVWLLATGASTALASGRHAVGSARLPGLRDPQKEFSATTVLVALLCVFAVTGFFCIRLARLVSGSGVALGPLDMLWIVAVTVVPFTFINGVLLGALFSAPCAPCAPCAPRGQSRYGALYGAENAGAVAGALCVFVCIVLSARNSVIAAVSLAPFLFMAGKRLRVAGLVLCCMVCLVLFDTASLHWKYPGMPVSRIIYGHEAEILSIATGTDTTLLVNGGVYRSTMEKPMCEQAVHIPMAQRPHAVHALVVFDRGQGAELSKYQGLVVDIIETEPALAARGDRASGGAARVASVESLRPSCRYDAVFLGTGIPITAASNRFYTRTFFLKAKSLMTDSGIISFSLPLSENYLSQSEQKLYNSLMSTLLAVWKNVAVFPGEGYTFMASDGPCVAMPPQVQVKTEYLASSIIPGVSRERIQSANRTPDLPLVNTRDRPVTLLLGLQTWLEQFKYGVWIMIVLFCAACVAVIILLPKTREAFSIATSGCATGIYSVCLLILYQATFGSLYSRVSLLLVGLTAGFALGSLVKRFPFSDVFIGLYAVVSLWALAALPFPPAILFYLFHAGIGILAGAQFATFGAARGTTTAASLYAADLFGGALGMAVCSTLLVPLFGIMPVATGIFAVKALVEITNHFVTIP